MRLSEASEARVRGYLFILKRSLETFMPRTTMDDALRELESHLRERLDQVAPEPDERTALEAVRAELGHPSKVAQAYSGELLIDEAVATGRAGAMARALWHLATTTVLGFLLALGLLSGYSIGFSLFAVAALKPIFPGNVGLLVADGLPRAFGVFGSIPPGSEVRGGYWIVPIALALGLALLVATHRGSRRALLWWRGRRSAGLEGPTRPSS